jgi:hypothetical protein
MQKSRKVLPTLQNIIILNLSTSTFSEKHLSTQTTVKGENTVSFVCLEFNGTSAPVGPLVPREV